MAVYSPSSQALGVPFDLHAFLVVGAAVVGVVGVVVAIVVAVFMFFVAKRVQKRNAKTDAMQRTSQPPPPSAAYAPPPYEPRGPVSSVPTPAPAPTPPSSPPAPVRRLMELRDQFTADAELRAETSSPAWLYARLGTILGDFGVESIETGGGTVDYRLQEAVGTKSTTDAALDGTIAATVRPGYRFGGSVIRAQQVVVYVVRPGV